MDITDVRIKLVGAKNDRLQAYCSITIDHSFVIRDLKIIDGAKGPFVAMPSRKLADRCRKCSSKNHLRAKFCSECGAKLVPSRNIKMDGERPKLHADIAHPINTECRESLQAKILEAFHQEVARWKELGKEPPRYSPDDDFDDFDDYLQSSGDTED